MGYVTPDNAQALFELMAREFAAVRDEGVTAAELEEAKDLLVGSIKRSTQTPGDLLGWYFDPYDESGEIRDFNESMELLREVRGEAVMAVASKAVGSKRHGMSLLGDLNNKEALEFEKALSPMWLS
jgi:predicted Zn-dependent peptidase